MNTTNAEILNVTCGSNGSWIPDPADFIQACSLLTTVTIPQGIYHKLNYLRWILY